MKKFSPLTAVAVVSFALAFAPVVGQAQTINHRLADQHARIRQGVKSGELTRKEASVVRTDDKLIHSEERLDRATDHGKLTSRERVSLNKQLNSNSARIYRLKHNARTRG